MHDLCLISASGHGRHVPRPAQDLDQPPTLKARRRNAVQGRRLALHVSLLEKNLAAREAERAREVRHLRDELRQMRAPLKRQRTHGPLSPRHAFPHVGHDVMQGHRLPGTRDDDHHQHHHHHYQSHHNNMQLMQQHDFLCHATHQESQIYVLPRESQETPRSGDAQGNEACADVPEAENNKENAKEDVGLDHSTSRVEPSAENPNSTLLSKKETEDEGHIPLGVPFRRLSLPRVLQSLTRPANRTSRSPRRQVVIGASKGSLPALRLQGKGVEVDTEQQGDSVARSGGVTQRSSGDQCGPNETAEPVVTEAVHDKLTGNTEPSKRETQGLNLNQTEKSPRPHKGRATLAVPAPVNSTVHAATVAVHKGVKPRESSASNARRAADHGTPSGNKACALAGLAGHKCRYFPCVQPGTYHSLGFHPDTDTHTWPAWIHMTASRPHHRLASGRAPLAPTNTGGRETPADVPFYARRRGFGRKEHARLQIMARRKQVHELERPPSWNTNYGEPTPYKRLNYPVSSLQTMD